MNVAVKPYIFSGIEWTLDKEFIYGIENAKYTEAMINTNDSLPIVNGEIKFQECIWDLRPFYSMKKSIDLIFQFDDVPDAFLANAKFFVLLSLLHSDKKASSLNRRFQDIKLFLRYLESNNINSLEHVLPKTLNDFFTTKDHCAAQTKAMTYIAVEDFFKFIKANYSYNLKFQMSIFDKKIELQTIAEKTRENNKTPDIPKEYFNQLISLLIKAMRDTSLEYNDRAIACIYIILSQTGLRISDILSLQTNSLKSITLKNIGATAYFLRHVVHKSAGKEQEYIENDIFANLLTKEAFETLMILREDRVNKIGNNFIYLPYTDNLPATYSLSQNHFLSFLNKYADFARQDKSSYPELSVKTYSNTPLRFPTTPQFRVHLCTELYYRNVPLLYISKFMSHLSSHMMGYYVRPKSKAQEDVEYSNKLLKQLITNEVSLLGNDAKEIAENIENFIREGSFNVENDIDAIIESLNKKFVIRAKRCGVCIKTSIRECSKDARTNEMFCAYNLCPNLFHLYYMADSSYEDFVTMQKTFRYNKSNGFKVAASKELNKLQYLCKNRLMPELKDLKQRINSTSIEAILEDYPNLSEIILRYDEIMEEINLWMKKKY